VNRVRPPRAVGNQPSSRGRIADVHRREAGEAVANLRELPARALLEPVDRSIGELDLTDARRGLNDLHSKVGRVARVLGAGHVGALVERGVEAMLTPFGAQVEPARRGVVLLGARRIEAAQGERPAQAGRGPRVRDLATRRETLRVTRLREVPELRVVDQRESVREAPIQRETGPDRDRDAQGAVEQRDLVDVVRLVGETRRDSPQIVRVDLRLQGRARPGQTATEQEQPPRDLRTTLRASCHGRFPPFRASAQSPPIYEAAADRENETTGARFVRNTLLPAPRGFDSGAVGAGRRARVGGSRAWGRLAAGARPLRRGATRLTLTWPK